MRCEIRYHNFDTIFRYVSSSNVRWKWAISTDKWWIGKLDLFRLVLASGVLDGRSKWKRIVDGKTSSVWLNGICYSVILMYRVKRPYMRSVKKGSGKIFFHCGGKIWNVRMINWDLLLAAVIFYKIIQYIYSIAWN